MNIIPRVHGSSHISPDRCALSPVLRTETSDFERWCVEAFFARTGTKDGSSDFRLVLRRDPALPEESYRLTVTENAVTVAASAERGVVWALTTAANLCERGTLPCCIVEDGPRFPHRGVLLDCARHFFPVGEVKRVIEGISLAKMNVLHWHLSDDQGWRIESRRFPKLTETGPFYTHQEIREVVEFARVRGVAVVPEIDMPGHVTAILAAYPELSCSGQPVSLAEHGGIFPIILCPGKEETFQFVESLLEEILPLFPDPRFHIGGDEAPKSEWEKCPHCRARMEALGLKDTNALQGDFTARVQEVLKKHGKQAICWNETLLAENAPHDIQIQFWSPQHRAAMEPFLASGGKWIYSDMFDLYFDYPHSMTPLSRVYKTQPHVGKKLCGPEDGLIGLECCLWTEHISEPAMLEQRLFPRVLAAAELAWSVPGDPVAFAARVRRASEGLLGRTVRFTPEPDWDPRGNARREDALAYLSMMFAGFDRESSAEASSTSALDGEFVKNFLLKFLSPSDLPFLLARLRQK